MSFSAAEAKPKPKLVTISLTAVVDFVYDPVQIACTQVAAGDVITATYTYDPASSDSNTSDLVGDYWQSEPGTGIQVDLGDAIARSDPATSGQFLIELVNNNFGDFYLLRSYVNSPLSCGSLVRHISWQLDDPTETALRDDDLSKKPPRLADFTSVFGLDVEIEDSSGFETALIRAHVTSVH